MFNKIFLVIHPYKTLHPVEKKPQKLLKNFGQCENPLYLRFGFS